MAEPHVISALRAKRAELSGDLIAAQKRLEKLPRRASTPLKAKMKEADVIYVELVKRLEAHGFKETEALRDDEAETRGTFAATWLLACLAALDLEGIRLEEI